MVFARDATNSSFAMHFILALDLEGTLISTAVSQFPRPHLYRFLEECRSLFSRIVMFTTVSEARFRTIAQLMIDEGKAPAWFGQLEYVAWSGRTKNLEFIPGASDHEALLVDDLASYVHPGQQPYWVQVEPFESPYPDSDSGLLVVLDELRRRVLRGRVDAGD